MKIFVEVARTGGFASAARRLGMSTSSVSRQILNLEDHFGRQLFLRTTRSLRLTQSGEEMLEACRKIVEDYDAMIQDRARVGEALTGTLTVTVPHFVMSVLVREFLPEFTRNHPHVRLIFTVEDAVTNLVADGHDLAVRVGALPDSALMARKLADLRLSLVCSDAYVAAHGEPRTPQELADHICIVDTVAPYRDRWPFLIDGEVRRVEISGPIHVNSGPAARGLAISGVGITLLPELLCYMEVERGELRTLLDDFVPVAGGIYVVYPRARYPTAVHREFTDALATYLRRYTLSVSRGAG
jgi:DNA-binding transcriptional LysR family regulator